MATVTGTDSSNIRAARRMDWYSKDGKIPMIRCFTPTESWRTGPIALCEVQGYVYAAKRGAAHLALVLGDRAEASALESQAAALRKRFDEAFWCDEISTYALALDGNKRPCRVRTSNPGHCLYTGIASADHAFCVAHSLLKKEFFSGWGIRTLASGEARYNPLSYHNGSIWPHDNALIAAGLARYGFKDMAGEVLSGLLAVSTFVDLNRLPELFCGLDRRAREGPTLYPGGMCPAGVGRRVPRSCCCNRAWDSPSTRRKNRFVSMGHIFRRQFPNSGSET